MADALRATSPVADALRTTWPGPCRITVGGRHSWSWDRRNECQRCAQCGLFGLAQPLPAELEVGDTTEVVTPATRERCDAEVVAHGGCDASSAPEVVTADTEAGCDGPRDEAATRRGVTARVEVWLAALGPSARGAGVTTLEMSQAIGLPGGRSSETLCGEALRARGWRAIQRRAGGRRERRYFPLVPETRP
jgi:hypothetical protein